MRLLAINGLMGVIEAAAGGISSSTGLSADSLDMFADAAVYAVALSVVGKTERRKTGAAMLSGVFQILLGALVVGDVLRRFVEGEQPLSAVMLIVSVLALLANNLCLALINKHRYGEVHMRASWSELGTHPWRAVGEYDARSGGTGVDAVSPKVARHFREIRSAPPNPLPADLSEHRAMR